MAGGLSRFPPWRAAGSGPRTMPIAGRTCRRARGHRSSLCGSLCGSRVGAWRRQTAREPQLAANQAGPGRGPCGVRAGRAAGEASGAPGARGAEAEPGCAFPAWGTAPTPSLDTAQCGGSRRGGRVRHLGFPPALPKTVIFSSGAHAGSSGPSPMPIPLAQSTQGGNSLPKAFAVFGGRQPEWGTLRIRSRTDLSASG